MDLVVGRYRRGGNRYRQISHKAHRAIVHEQNPSTPDHSRIIPESSRQASREPDDFSRQGSTATGHDDFSRQGSTATGQSEIPGLPFYNVKRSKDVSLKNFQQSPLEFKHPPSSNSENYHDWMSGIVEDNLKDVDEQTVREDMGWRSMFACIAMSVVFSLNLENFRYIQTHNLALDAC
jgi:hypothetical protein